MSGEHPDPSVWWKHRRRHSYASLLGLFGLLLTAANIDPVQLAAADSLLIALAWIFGGIVVAYVTAATTEDILTMRAQK